MNPDAKEFVPAHILKRRQEEKEAKETAATEKTLDDVTDKLEKVDLKSGDTTTSSSCRISSGKEDDNSREVQDANEKPNSSSSNQPRPQNGYTNHGDYPEEQQDLNGEDDRYLLNAGENICEFNGEQFIVPGDDDEYEQQPGEGAAQAGYDFGNAEDNEDEDVCNAFEEFLGGLPDE